MSVMAAGAVPAVAATAEGEREKHRGTLLALGIVLLWLAGLGFYFAFEGIQAEQSDTTGAGLFKSLIGDLSSKAQAQENQEG